MQTPCNVSVLVTMSRNRIYIIKPNLCVAKLKHHLNYNAIAIMELAFLYTE